MSVLYMIFLSLALIFFIFANIMSLEEKKIKEEQLFQEKNIFVDQEIL